MKIAHIHVADRLNKGDIAIVESIQDILKTYFKPLEILDFDLLFLKNFDEEVAKRINSCDIVVIGGGGVYVRYFLPFSEKSIDSINKPIVLFGTGYNLEFGAKALDGYQTKNINKLVNKSALVSVRDESTLNFLKSLGIKRDIWLTGDPACLLNFPPIRPILTQTPAVGFNITYSGWLGFGTYKKTLMDSYSLAMNLLAEKWGYKIYYLLHHPSEREIIKELKFKDFQIIDLNPKKQTSFYSKLDLVVCMMLHCAILSFAASTPLVNIAYDIKNISFANFIDSPKIIVNPQDLTPSYLNQKIEGSIKNREAIKKQFTKEKKILQKANSEFMKKVSAI